MNYRFLSREGDFNSHTQIHVLMLYFFLYRKIIMLIKEVAMYYLLDTANIEDIKRGVEYYPIIGVTTNPSIIAREKK